MMSVVTYIRNLMGWSDETPLNRLNFKRDRTDEGLSSDDDTPTIKRPKQLLKTRFPASMASNNTTNGWGKEEKESNVRYVPIQMESRHPSTSTPMESTAKMGARVRTVPIKLVGVRDSASSTPARKPRSNAPIMHAVLDDVDDDEQEVQLVKVKPEVKKKQKVFINLDDYEDELPNDDDVIFVKKVKTPPPSRPYKFFLTDDSQDVPDAEQPIRYRLSRKLNDRSSMSPKPYSKFIAPPGITKSYKKNPTPVSRLWQGSKSTTNFPRNNFLSQNGNTRTTLAEVFNLDEKKNYKELIKRVTESMNPAPFGKRFDSMDLLEEMASFRNTQKAQKKALQDINFIQKGILSDKTNAALKEYDPITVASLNSSDSEVELVPSDTSVSSSVRIDPINTLKDSYRDKAITSKDWLTKLNTKYKKKDLDVREKLKDARRESDIISKVVTEQKLAQLEHKLKYELSIPESLFEEPQPTVELPPLTPEQEKLVNRALGPGPAGQLLVEKFNLRIHRRDLQTLSGLNWLNDEVINFYMNLLMQRSEERKDLPKVYAANTFFYPKLMQNGQAGLRRWTRKVDIFANDLMIVPVHLGVHWCLSIVDFRAKKISYLDSMGGRNQLCLDALLRYLRDEHRDKKGQPFDDNGWTTECLKDIPQQMNGSDCGMFACTFAEFSARNAPYTFSQSHMPYLRRKAALEILSGKLLL